MNSEFENIVSNKLNQLDENPPSGVWDNISDELDLQDVWNNISNELDVQEVWQNIDSKLTVIARRQTFVKVASFAALLLLLIGSSFLFVKPTDKHLGRLVSDYPLVKNNYSELAQVKLKNGSPSSDLTTVSEKKAKSSKQVAKSKKATKSKKELKKEAKKNLNSTKQNLSNGAIATNRSYKRKAKGHASKKTINPKSEENQLPLIGFGSNAHPIAVIQPFNMFTMLQPDSEETTMARLNQNTLSHPAKDAGYTPKCVDRTGYLIVGSSYTYSNTWILNSISSSSYERNSLNQTNISFGYVYSLFIGYHLSSRLTLQSECLINNKQEQSYIEYREGKRVYENLEINYTQVNLLAKKTNPQVLFNNLPASFNYIGGIQYGYMKSINETENGVTSSVSENYKKNNYSLVLGFEYQIMLNRSFSIFAGLRADVGLNNLYVGNTSNSKPNKTYNTSIGLNSGIAYRIPMKRKK